MYRRGVLLGKFAEAGYYCACVQKQCVAGQVRKTGYCWGNVQRQGFAGQACRSMVLLCLLTEAERWWASAQKQVVDGMFAEAERCWASASQGVSEQVCRSMTFQGKYVKAGYCRASVRKHGIARQVCSSR